MKILSEKIKEIFESELFKEREKNSIKYSVSRWQENGEFFEAHHFKSDKLNITTGRGGAEMFEKELRHQFKNNLFITNAE